MSAPPELPQQSAYARILGVVTWRRPAEISDALVMLVLAASETARKVGASSPCDRA